MVGTAAVWQSEPHRRLPVVDGAGGRPPEMMTIDCASCGSAVPPGRLACPACGELLASVSGRVVAPRVVVREADPVPEPAPFLEPDLEPEFAFEASSSGGAEPHGGFDPPLAKPPAAKPPAADPSAAAVLTAPVLASAPDAEPPASPIAPSASFRPGAPFTAATDLPPIDPDEPVPASWPGRPDPSAPRLEDVQAAAAARSAGVAASAASTPSSDPVASATPAGTGARAPGVVPPLPVPLGERLVAIAAGVVAVAFLLPWGDIVIGAAVVGEPWQRLGILASWHWLAWLGALPVILLATAAPAVPAWLRLGVVPIAYGGLVIGLVWPYVLGPIGGAPAPIVAAVVSLVLIALGALGVRPAPGPR